MNITWYLALAIVLSGIGHATGMIPRGWALPPKEIKDTGEKAKHDAEYAESRAATARLPMPPSLGVDRGTDQTVHQEWMTRQPHQNQNQPARQN